MKVEIESLQSTDWSEFYRLFKKVLKRDFPGYPRQVKEKFASEIRVRGFLEEKKRFFWVVKARGKIVGFLVAKGTLGGVSFVNWFGVAREFRCQGIGTKLLKVWQSWAREKGYHKLRISTTNKENQAFYEKLGFSLEGVKREDSYGLDQFIFGKVVGKFTSKSGL